MRKLSLSVHQLLDHAEAAEARHLNIEKYEVRRMFADQGERLDAVFPLAHKMNLGKTLQQVGQFIARRFLVVDNERVNWHEGMKFC